ncbi:MAG: desulfoferrodoxin [Candidatus Woesearchaeota archaeon]
MANLGKIYKCEQCKNIVSVLEAGEGELVCCGEPMKIMEEKTAEQEGKEKHVPVVEINGNEVTVRVGSVNHPMEDSHYIELIQIIKDNDVTIGKRLKPGQEPKAVFNMEDTSNIKARILCNIHGVWVSD